MKGTCLVAVDLLIVADDLTGAIDAAAPFAAAGGVAVARRPAALLAAAGTGARVVAALRPGRLGEVGVLFACGGETADAILGAAGLDVLEVVGEPFPGVPPARALRLGDGPGGTIEVVTKSGGFGGPNLLARLWRELGAGSPAVDRVAG